jgi:hypothetical protein
VPPPTIPVLTMSDPYSDNLQTLTASIAALSGQVSGLLSRITELERQPRSGIAGPPTTPKQQRGSKRSEKGKTPQRIATVASTAVPLTFPLAQDLPKGKSSDNRFAMTCVIPDACAGHVIGRQGRGLKQVADISGARVAAFSVKEQNGPSFGQRHVTIRGTEEQIGAALGVVGKRLARQRVRTPRPAKGKGKEARAGEKQQPTFSIPFEPPAAAAAARRPSPPRGYPPASETPGSYAYELAHPTVGSATPMSISQTANTTPASPMSVQPSTTPASPMNIGAAASSGTGRHTPLQTAHRGSTRRGGGTPTPRGRGVGF